MRKAFTRVKDFYEKHATLLKMVFILSVLLFVFTEIGRIFHQLNWHQVGEALSDQSPVVIIAMLVCGLIAVLPMLIYDFVIVKFLPGDFSTGYIARSGWVQIRFTNVRALAVYLERRCGQTFIKTEQVKGNFICTLQIALFLLAGLSIFCWISW